MSKRLTRFLQAGDFHLEAVPRGLAEVPDAWRTTLVEAPFRAATAVFDAALAEDVDFLLLCGNLLHVPSTGPRGLLFLLDQFTRLAAHEIPIFWLQAGVDLAEGWPAGVPLPASVHLLSAQRAEQVASERPARPKAMVVSLAHGASDHALRAAAPLDVPVIALCAGPPPVVGHHPEVGYWACGGSHESTTPAESAAVVHYAGGPQGCSPDEPGPHGATLVEWEPGQRPRLRSLVTDAVRWHREEIVLEPHWRRIDLETACRRRIGELLAQPGEPDLLVAWNLVGVGDLARSLRRGSAGGEFLEWLQREFGTDRPLVWSTQVEIDAPAELPPELLRQDNLLGDYLRELRKLESAGALPTPAAARDGSTGTAAFAEFADPAAARRVWRQAALLGVDLLSGQEVQA